MKFTDLIGTFSKSIISLYYGHVNRDIVNFVYKTKEKYEIGPLNQKALLDPKTSSLEIVGTLFTGSSVVPYFYPSFRVGVLEGEKVISHTQFSSRIGDEVVFNETCSTVTTLGMTGLGGEEFKAFLGNVQHELDVAGKSLLAGRYWDCSMVHYGSVENVKKSNQGMMIGFSILGFFTILMIHFKFKSGRGRIAI